jgi:hypothetical protein
MMVEYKTAYVSFVLGVIAFHFSAAIFGWLMFAWPIAGSVTLMVIGSLSLLLRYAQRVYTRFRLPSDDVVTGRFVAAAAGGTTVAGQDGEAEGANPGEARDLGALISNEQAQLAAAQADEGN